MRNFSLFLLFFLSAFVFSCSSGGGGNNNDADMPLPVVIPETTKVADTETANSLIKIEKIDNQEKIVFSKETDVLKNLNTGDIFIMQPVDNIAPYGIIRKIKSKTVNPDGSVVLETEPATLTEAIESGEIEETIDLNFSNVKIQSLSKGVKIKKANNNGITYSINEDISPGIRLVGDISIQNPKLYFKLRISLFTLKEITAKITASETAKLQVVGQAGYSASAEKELASIELSPIIFTIGVVPIVINPKITLAVGINGKIYAKLTAGVKQTLGYTIGATYTDTAGAKRISELQRNFSPTTMSVDGNVNIHPYISGSFELNLYDVIGPGGTVEAYLDFDAKAMPDLICSLDAGVSSGFEIKGEVLSYSFVDIKVDLFKIEQNLAKCSPPQLLVSPKNFKISSGFETSQNFSPSEFIYTLDVYSLDSNNNSVNYKINTSEPWLNISQSSGIVQGGSPQDITVSINQTEASKLPKGTYTGIIEFINTNPNSNQPPIKQIVYLEVKEKPAIKVLPQPNEIPLIKGNEGGPFNPNTLQFTIIAEGGDVSWEIQKNVDWIDLSQTSGTLTDGSSITVDVSINQNANNLPPGGHKAILEFKNITDLGNGIISGEGNTKRNIYLNANIYSYPSKLSFCAVKAGDSFIPPSQFFYIKSKKSAFTYSLKWTKDLINIDRVEGDVPANGEVKVQVTPNETAKGLSNGSYIVTIVPENKNSDFSFSKGLDVVFDIGVRGCGRAFMIDNAFSSYFGTFDYKIENNSGGYVFGISFFKDGLSGRCDIGLVGPTGSLNFFKEFGFLSPDNQSLGCRIVNIKPQSGVTYDVFFMANESEILLTKDLNGNSINPTSVRGGIIQKIDSSGNVLWSKQFYTRYDIHPVGAIETSYNQFIFAGNARGMDIKNSPDESSIYIASVDTSGNLKNVNYYQSSYVNSYNRNNWFNPNDDAPSDINWVVDNMKIVSGNYIVSGWFYEGWCNYLKQYNLICNGLFILSANISNPYSVNGVYIGIASQDNIYIASDIDINGNVVVLNKDKDINDNEFFWIIKINPNGSVAWKKQISLKDYTTGFNLRNIRFIDNGESILLVGEEKIPFDYSNYGKAIVIKLSSSDATLQWAYSHYSDNNGEFTLANAVETYKRGYVAIGKGWIGRSIDSGYVHVGPYILEMNPDGSLGTGLPYGNDNVFCGYTYKPYTNIKDIADYIGNITVGTIPFVRYNGTENPVAFWYGDLYGTVYIQDIQQNQFFTCDNF